jgi:hypothetical protein
MARRVIKIKDKKVLAALKKQGERAGAVLSIAAQAGADILQDEISAEFSRRRVSGRAAQNFVTKPGKIKDKFAANIVVTLREKGEDREYPFYLEFGAENRKRGGTLPAFGLIRKAYQRKKAQASAAVLAAIKRELDL